MGRIVRRWLRRLKFWLALQALPDDEQPPHWKLTPYGESRIMDANEFMRRKHGHPN